jgi:hypothetical protein
LAVSEVASQVKVYGLALCHERYPPLFALRETVATETGTEAVAGMVLLVLVKRTELMLHSLEPVFAIRID